MFMRNFFAAMLLLVTLLAPLASRAGPVYTVTSLPGIDFTPIAMNNTGQVVGNLGRAHGAVHAMLYDDGVVTDLGAFGARHSWAAAINDAGVITGSLYFASGEEHGFFYGSGGLTDLGAGTAGFGINARGDVVGSIRTAAGSAGFVYRDGALVELGNLGTGTEGYAAGINDHGVIAGASAPDAANDTSRHPWLYSGGVLHDLGTLAGRAYNGAAAINNAGQVAGYSEGADGFVHALLYEQGVLHDLGSFGGSTLVVGDLNAHGALVGTAIAQDQLIPFVSVGNALTDLNTLIDPTLGWRITSAYANNDLGQIIGAACRDDVCGIVRLDLAGAVPEPGAALLLLAGVTTLAGARWRRRQRRLFTATH